MLASDAPTEKPTVVVQIFHADLAIVAVSHVHLLPIAGLAKLDLAALGDPHVILTDDSRVHGNGEEVGYVNENCSEEL